MNKQKGLSLIELMIAITLGLVLMGGVIQMFLSSRQVFTTQQAMARIQESGRLAMEFMARDIRMAGYMGCMTRTEKGEITNTLNDSDDFDNEFNVGIEGYSAASAPAGIFDPAPVNNTDIVVLRSASGDGAQISQDNNSSQLFASLINIDEDACSDGSDRISGMCQGDIAVVADCTKARIFQITEVSEAGGGKVNVVHSNAGTVSPGNADSSWGGSSDPDNERFEPGAEVMIASNTAYYIAEGTSDRPSLWQRSNRDNLELLEGVEKMSLRYGVDTNGDVIPDAYRTAAQVTAADDWSSVLSVRIELLVASIEENVLAEPQPYVFAGVNSTPAEIADRRLRMVFVNTVGIRSRLP